MKDNDIKISMDGEESGMDNVTVDDLWRSAKYEEVYLKTYDSFAREKRALAIANIL